MKKLSFALLATASFFVNAQTCEYKKEFSDTQWDNIRSAYLYGWSNDISWTLSAIIINESSAGIILINEASKDYGMFQNNIITARTRLTKWKENGREFDGYDLSNDEHIKEILIENSDISASLAVEEILFWKRVRGSNKWSEIYASYNGGFYKGRLWETRAERYSRKINKTIGKLKPCQLELTKGFM